MLTISKAQRKVFSNLFLKKFEDEMVEHIKKYFPNHFISMQEPATRNTIRYAYIQGGNYGFDSKKDVCLFLNNMLIWGSDFHMDPQYPWAKAIIGTDPTFNPGIRSDKLSKKGEEVYNEIAGPELIYITNAYQNLRENKNEIFQKIFTQKLNDAPYFLETIFPEKYKAIGEGNLKDLVSLGIVNAHNYGITGESHILVYIFLMFVLGSGFDIDPQFPWAKEILENTYITQEKKTELVQQAWVNWVNKFVLN